MPPFYCMVMRINIDCSGCFRKVREALNKIQELESHLIERRQGRVTVWGAFEPQAVAIRVRKAINRRVEILDVGEIDRGGGEMVLLVKEGKEGCWKE
ncbi:hypothetical protein HPP92_026751 [Vanilla planifolia]|uniref:HMA domain-containing protein n=1 Tax=Vanilla planifolia TaxID=51239 RepID=A0A835U8U7_VANPL|nr:hypothetical protein HPP92_026751 [Vanilla planifolia]